MIFKTHRCLTFVIFCFMMIYACLSEALAKEKSPMLWGLSPPSSTGNLDSKHLVRRLQINVDYGTLSIESTDKKPFWKYETIKGYDNCRSVTKQFGDKWIIESKKDQSKIGDCRVHWTIGVSKHLAKLVLNVGNASVTIHSLQVDKLRLNAGSLTFTTKDFQGRSQHLNMGSADIHMLWTKKPRPQVVDINAGHATLLIEAPQNVSCTSKIVHPPLAVSKEQNLPHGEKADITITGAWGSGTIKTTPSS